MHTEILRAIPRALTAALLSCLLTAGAFAQDVRDPGPRAGAASAGGALPGLTAPDQAAFAEGLARFLEVDTPATGLGPRFNGNACAQCHAQPGVGGSSPPINPQFYAAVAFGAHNSIPSFLSKDGPVREARLKRNPDGTAAGGVADLFVIAGRTDAPPACAIKQPDFAREVRLHNVIFRIPTPVFGGGLIEAITDDTIVANKIAYATLKLRLGIHGHENRNGNDGTITRFGWKAQNKSLLLFAGEAYNVEQGVTNPLFTTEREENSLCATNALPEDHDNFGETAAVKVPSDIVMFAAFMKRLAPPQPAALTTAAATRGKELFTQVGCGLCHTPTLPTGLSDIAQLNQTPASLYSDLLVHHMGTGLADGVSQGNAGPDEFRSAPLWGLGQRLFFLHDGRTSDLLAAIEAHKSPGSEANWVIRAFNRLPGKDEQAILDFLRTL